MYTTLLLIWAVSVIVLELYTIHVLKGYVNDKRRIE